MLKTTHIDFSKQQKYNVESGRRQVKEVVMLAFFVAVEFLLVQLADACC